MEDKKVSILVIDDEPDVVDILKNSLSHKGYEVNGALNGKEALDILKNWNADLVLLDIIMPGLKGTEVAKIVKERYPNTKILVITAYPQEGEVLFAEKIAEEVFIKPFRLHELYKKLDEMLNKDQAVDIEETAETKTRIIFVKADLLFVEPSLEVYNSLAQRFKELSCRGQCYNLDQATNDVDLMRKIRISDPDIVIFEESYLNTLDSHLVERILLFPTKTKEVISYDLTSAAYDFNTLEELVERIMALCIKNGLIEIR